MTIADLERAINLAEWFTRLGKFETNERVLAIKTLDAWRSEDAVVDEYHESIAENMKWLPSDVSEEDPIHGSSLKLLGREIGRLEECKSQSLEIYKLALGKMRTIPASPLLQVGPHDFNLSARKTACYAVRMAVLEIIVDKQSFWCSLIPIFSGGNLPCGIMPDGKVIVF